MEFDGRLADHAALAYADEVKAICEPFLKLLDLNYFAYFRIYNSCEIVGLLTDPYWFEHFVTQGFSYQSGKKLSRGVHLWANSHSDVITQDARTFFNHDHGLFVITEKEHYVESAIFATYAGNDAILETYLNKLGVLKLFVQHFQHAAADLLVKAHENRLYLKQAVDPSSELDSQELSDVLSEYFAPKGNNTLYIKDKVVKLTRREKETLIALCQGKSAKMIARDLDISPRTVEYYISQLRQKLSCHTSRELIQVALDHIDFRLLNAV